MDRNAWLRLDDAALLRQGREERHRASGPGGQRRNKVETAIKLRHGPSGVEVKANESRSLEENRRRAVRRLRERIAVEVRAPFDLETPSLPDEFVAQRGKDGLLRVKPKNPVYPIVVATALDALAAAEGSHARAARSLGITTSQLLRFLQSDAEVWRKVGELRKAARAEAAGAGGV
jgi:hypothetical protein